MEWVFRQLTFAIEGYLKEVVEKTRNKNFIFFN